MGNVNSVKAISVDAGADLSALQFTAVKSGTGRTCVSATDATAPIMGILMNKPVSGDPAEVAIGGIAKAKAGSGGWTAGQPLTATTGGALIATSTNNHHIVGYAHEAAAAGDIAQVRVAPGQWGA
jgi:hypothetical protein